MCLVKNKAEAAAFAVKVEAANKRAVAACDKAGLGCSIHSPAITIPRATPMPCAWAKPATV